MTALDRDRLEAGLRDLIARLLETGQPATVALVGGAALALRYFDRRITTDIDARITPAGPVLALAGEIAETRGWDPDWLNTAAAQFIPGLGRDPVWDPLYQDDTVMVAVASAETLLAMKLHAARPNRDNDDIATLMTLTGTTTLDAAEELYEAFYPGDALTDRALRLVTGLLATGLPPQPAPVDPARLAP